jgi:hypothetical protein
MEKLTCLKALSQVVCCKCSKNFLNWKINIRFKWEDHLSCVGLWICFEACGSFGAATIVWLGIDDLRWKIQSCDNRMLVEFYGFTFKLACHLPAGNMIIKWGFTTTEWLPDDDVNEARWLRLGWAELELSWQVLAQAAIISLYFSSL